MNQNIQKIKDKFVQLNKLRSSTFEKLQEVKGTNETQFDLSKPAPDTEHSIAGIDARVASVCALTTGIQSDSSDVLVPQSYLTDVANQVEKLEEQYQQIAGNLASIESNGGPGALDQEALALQSMNGAADLQIGPLFKNIWAYSESTLVALYPLLGVLRSHGIADFSEAVKSFATAMEHVHQQRAKLSEIAKAAQDDRKKVEQLHLEASPQNEEIERLKTESEKDRKTLAEYTTEGTQSITSIRGTTEQAEQLKTLVDGYKATFDNFQAQLDQREKTIQEGAKRQERLLKTVSEIEKQINGLNQQAEAMLSGATNAGLASSFGKLRDDLSRELIWARGVFYLSIVVLFLSVIPLAAYVLPGLGEFLSLPPADQQLQSASTSELVTQIIARVLLLLPAAWFAKFAAARHAALFRLKEHYAYKYSVASSVEGFKKQAAPYKDEIAATTFYELTFNPAERMDSKGDEDRHPNPAMDRLMKMMGATHDGKIG